LSSDVQNIVELLGPREVIGQAIACLMATNDVSRDAAFAILVRDSAMSRQTVREVAAAIVARRVDQLEPPGSEEVRSRALGQRAG
jgi:AmiR/NasT family two-component response regulator